MIDKIHGKYYAECDACGDILQGDNSFEDIRKQMTLDGWRSRNVKGIWLDYCPNCDPDENDVDDRR